MLPTFGRSEAASLKVKELLTSSAPAQRILAGAGVFICCTMLLAACENGARGGTSSDRTLELSADTIDLPKGVRLHDVQIRSAQNGDFDPAQTSARNGDIVRFTVRDTRTHGLVITGPSEQAVAALDATSQRRSPPLVSEGQSWVISLKNLPPGTYTLSCISHGGTGTLVIQ